MIQASDIQLLIKQGYCLIPLPSKIPFDLDEIQYDLIDFFLSGNLEDVGTPQSFEDLRTLFHVSKDETKLPRNLRSVLEVYEYMSAISLSVSHELSKAFNLPEHYFSHIIHNAHSFLRPTFYWPHSQGTLLSEPHVDTSLLTLLFGSTHDGLEIYLQKKNEWVPIKNQSRFIVVTFGSLFAEITNGLIPATLHRVVSHQSEMRLTLPFFVHGHDQALMEKINFNGVITPQARPLSYKQFLTLEGKKALLNYLV